jgi:hypothetical protein
MNKYHGKFVLQKHLVTSEQLEKIRNVATESVALGMSYTSYVSHWELSETPTEVIGVTDTDNFDFEDFFALIGVPETSVKWKWG